MTINIKRIYEEATDADGTRILVDRLWPRGISKEKAQLAYWAKNISPSNELRKWYQHDPTKWDEFRQRYYAEIESNPDALAELKDHLKADAVTFLYSSKETRLNNAVALKAFIENSL